jgi:hypothetical protein
LLRWCLVDELAPHEQRSQPTIAPHAAEVGRGLTIKEAIDLALISRAAVQIFLRCSTHRRELW